MKMVAFMIPITDIDIHSKTFYIVGHNFTLKIDVLQVGSVGLCLRMTIHECKWPPW